jgi:hypothetical protein
MSRLSPNETRVSCIKEWESLGSSYISFHTDIKFNPLFPLTQSRLLPLNLLFNTESQKMGTPPSEKQAADAADPITHVISNEELGNVEKLPDGLRTDIGLEL